MILSFTGASRPVICHSRAEVPLRVRRVRRATFARNMNFKENGGLLSRMKRQRRISDKDFAEAITPLPKWPSLSALAVSGKVRGEQQEMEDGCPPR